MDTTSERTTLRDMLAIDYGWTPRQREVLDLITRGRSNQEIADELGVSLDGAKWHMREILSKLGVDSREEAAEYWRRYNGAAPRFARLFRGLTGAGAGKWLAGALVGGALIGMGAVALLLALNGDDDPAAGDTEPTSTPTSTADAVSPTVSPTAAPTQGTPVARVITLDTSPQPQPPEVTRTLASPPDSIFPPWDGVSTVIYDTETGNAIDLGPGAQPASFSPDETLAVFASGSNFANGTEVFLVELPSGQRRSLGPGRVAQFQTDGSIMVILPGGNERVSVDPVTGARTPFTGDPNTSTNARPASVPPGYQVDPPDGPTSPAPVRTYTVSNNAGELVLTVDGVAMSAAGANAVAVVAPPVDGRSNVYIIDLVNGEATFIATAIPGKDNFPFSASEDYVLWTDGYCGPERGPVTLFDRETGELLRLDFTSDPDVDLRYMHLTTTGLLAAGTFGAKYLIDPETLEYLANIPSRPDGYGGDVWWSTNHRYASHGPYGGHGGLCGPD